MEKSLSWIAVLFCALSAAVWAAPAVESVEPASGPAVGGQTILVRGTGFLLAGTTLVLFDGIPGREVVVVALDTGELAVRCVTPAHDAGLSDVAVVNPNGFSGRLIAGYVFNPVPPPAITEVVPRAGLTFGRPRVRVAGSKLSAVPGYQVFFGRAPAANPASVTDFVLGPSLECPAPAHMRGPVNVSVIGPDGQAATQPHAFTYVAAPAPIPEMVVPESGTVLGGDCVQILGQRFSTFGTVSVLFGGVPLTDLRVIQAGYETVYIECTTPPHEPGPVPVAVINPDGVLGVLHEGFTYLPVPQPAEASER